MFEPCATCLPRFRKLNFKHGQTVILRAVGDVWLRRLLTEAVSKVEFAHGVGQ